MTRVHALVLLLAVTASCSADGGGSVLTTDTGTAATDTDEVADTTQGDIRGPVPDAGDSGQTAPPAWRPPVPIDDICPACDPPVCESPPPTQYDSWPNPESRANSDRWLAEHHEQIRVLRPKLLVLNLANPASPDHAEALVDQIVAGFREGSRSQGSLYEDSPPQLEYDVLPIVDLRDGVDGRPPPPDDYPYENSTLTPRRDESEEGAWRLDYAEFFTDDFAPNYGFENPDAPGEFLDLCDLVDRGMIHELWFIGSGDVPDVNAAEVLEFKQKWTPDGEKLVGEFERCAGNGCFDPDVPRCDRSIRIGFVNYNRGPGCYLHSQGHGLEWAANSGAVPALTEWFQPFAGFDLDERYALPVRDLYGVSCSDDTCIERTSSTSIRVEHDGSTYDVDGYDPRCGNVHFPPNGVAHYDYGNSNAIEASCADFGRHSLSCGEYERELVSVQTWAANEMLAPDCGGAFLVWWYQNMPGFGSEQYFDDGRPMKSVWPFLFY